MTVARHVILAGLAALSAACPAQAADSSAALPSVERQKELVRIVRQDCGSCHGMQLTGGLGPALTREALADRPLQALAATVWHGRPGTPMPPWKSMLSEDDVMWIAQQLQAGFPSEASGKAR